MEQSELLLRLGLALAIGFLIGLERGWHERDEKEGHRTAGIRTFSLSGLLGRVFGAPSLSGDPIYAWIAGGSRIGLLSMLATLLAMAAGAQTSFGWIN